MTEYQRCIVHVVRNTLKYVADKDKKAFANDLKTIYHAPDEQSGHARMEAVAKAWNQKYPGCMNRLAENWDVISPMFKFSETARKVLYTTNAIESLNSGYRRLNRSRSVFPNDMSLLKALYAELQVDMMSLSIKAMRPLGAQWHTASALSASIPVE